MPRADICLPLHIGRRTLPPTNRTRADFCIPRANSVWSSNWAA